MQKGTWTWVLHFFFLENMGDHIRSLSQDQSVPTSSILIRHTVQTSNWFNTPSWALQIKSLYMYAYTLCTHTKTFLNQTILRVWWVVSDTELVHWTMCNTYRFCRRPTPQNAKMSKHTSNLRHLGQNETQKLQWFWQKTDWLTEWNMWKPSHQENLMKTKLKAQLAIQNWQIQTTLQKACMNVYIYHCLTTPSIQWQRTTADFHLKYRRENCATTRLFSSSLDLTFLSCSWIHWNQMTGEELNEVTGNSSFSHPA